MLSTAGRLVNSVLQTSRRLQHVKRVAISVVNRVASCAGAFAPRVPRYEELAGLASWLRDWTWLEYIPKGVNRACVPGHFADEFREIFRVPYKLFEEQYAEARSKAGSLKIHRSRGLGRRG